jgi:hypothetical protein
MSKLEANTIDTISGTSNLVIGSTNSSTVTFESGAATGHMSPAFEAYLSAFQGIANNTYVKAQFNTEVFDTDNAYDNSSNYRFTVPTGKGGKYFITAQVNLKCNSGNNLQTTFIALYINGSAVNTHHKNDSAFNTSNYSRRDTRFISTILDLSAGDYVEVYAQLGDNSHDIGGSGIQANNAKASSFFAGYRIGA